MNINPKNIFISSITALLITLCGCSTTLEEPTKDAITHLDEQIDYIGKGVLHHIKKSKSELKKPSSPDDIETAKNNIRICKGINDSINNVEKQLKAIEYNDPKIPAPAQRLLVEKINSYIEFYNNLSIINNILIKNEGNMHISKKDMDKIKAIKFYLNIYIRKCKDVDSSLSRYLKNESPIIPFSFDENIIMNGIIYNVNYAEWSNTLTDNELMHKDPEHTYLFVSMRAKNTKNYDQKLPNFALLDEKGKIHEVFGYSRYSKDSFNAVMYLKAEAKEEGFLVFDVPEGSYYKLLIYNKSPKVLRYIYVNPKPKI